MKSCPYDHAEMQSYGHHQCPYCRMPLATMDGSSRSDAPETESRTFVPAMGPPLIGGKLQTENTQAASDCQKRLVQPLDFEGNKRRFEEAVESLDRYGIPHEGIINMLDALSDYIEDEAHGRGGYGAHFKIIQDELDALRSCSLMSDDNCVSRLVGRLVFAGDLEVNGEEISGCALDIDRPTLITAKSLPMYERCAIITAAELRKMEAVIEEANNALEKARKIREHDEKQCKKTLQG